MSNHHSARSADEINLFARRIKAMLNDLATAVRQFWQGYLLSPSGC